jgi:hypothetical protein
MLLLLVLRLLWRLIAVGTVLEVVVAIRVVWVLPRSSVIVVVGGHLRCKNLQLTLRLYDARMMASELQGSKACYGRLYDARSTQGDSQKDRT